MLASHKVEGSTPVTMLGCGHVVALSTIAFKFATGVARCALVAELTWWNDDLYSDNNEVASRALEAISKAMGTPVRFVRAYHYLTPAQRRSIELLMSTDAGERLEGAKALQAMWHDRDFQDHESISSLFIEDHLDALWAARSAESRSEVRSWLKSLNSIAEG